MIFHIIFIFLILVSLVFESSIFPFPLVVLISLMYGMFFRNTAAFLAVFLASLILDVLVLNYVGVTAVFLFSIFAIFIILEKVFSFQGSIFTACGIMAAVLVHGILIGYPFSIVLTSVAAIILILYFFIIQKKQKEIKTYEKKI